MKFKLRDIATSVTTLVFIVVGVSGVMLYFKIFNGQVKELHEILGLAFVVAAFFHVFVNWKAMKNYFGKKVFITSCLVVAIISGIFVSQSLNRGNDPKGMVLRSIITAPIQSSLSVLNIDYETAINKLKDSNMQGLDKKTIGEIAKANSSSPFKIIAIISSK